MRWFVEISSLGAKAEPPVKLTVEAPQWQPALQKARAMRGDDGALNNFSIELLDDGYRAVDPNKRLRYVVRKAPDNAPLSPTKAQAASSPSPATATAKKRVGAETAELTSSGSAATSAPSVVGVEPKPVPAAKPAPAAAKPAPAAVSVVVSDPAKTSKSRPLAQTMAYASKGAAAVRAEAEAIAQAKATQPSAGVAPPPSSYRVLSSREENPSASSPLTYREFVYVVSEGTSIDEATRLLHERFENVKSGLEGVQGKLVNMAIFDHAFEGRPTRPPLVTLTWKDWRGEPEIRPATKPAAPSTPPPAEKPAPARTSSPPEKKPTPAPMAAPKKASSPRVPRARTVDEIMADLEGAATDLHFLEDPLDAADFVITLIREKLASELVLVWFHDAEKRELVLVRQLGGKFDRLLARMPDRTGLANTAIANKKALVITDATRDPRAIDPRWKSYGVEPKSIAAAPALGGGKTLALIEIVNPEGGGRYATAEGHALTFIAKELGEFLTNHGVMLDPERITSTAKKAAR